MTVPSLDEILETFDLLDDWDERYEYLIELGHHLPPMRPEDQTKDTKVEGCLSQVWMVAELDGGDPPVMKITATSDSVIVRGLIAILLAVYAGRSPEQILRVDPTATFEKLELREHLSANRRNGLQAMVDRIRQLAAWHA